MTRRRGERGFTLVETLIASAIIAAMLGATMQTVIGNARAARLVEERRLATLIAQSQLAAAAASATGRLLDTKGVTSHIAWRVRIEPYAGQFASPRLEQIIVTAGSGTAGKPLVELRSIRIAT